MKIKPFIPFILWTIIILILLGIPGTKIPKIPSFLEWLTWDKLIHFILFGIFCYLFLWGIYKQKIIHKQHYITSLLIGVFYSGLTEILQHYVFIKRSGNWFDFLADIIGCILGCFLFYWIQKKRLYKSLH